MAGKVSDNLRATLLSLKQISARLKQMQNVDKQDIIDAINSIDFSAITSGVEDIDEKLGTPPVGGQADAFAYLAGIYDSIVGSVSPDVPEGVADRLLMLLNFFGVYADGDKVLVRGVDPENPTQIVPCEPMTVEEVKEIQKTYMEILFGYQAVPVEIHRWNTTQDADEEIDTYCNPCKTWSDYGFTELWTIESGSVETVDVTHTVDAFATDFPNVDGIIVYSYQPTV